MPRGNALFITGARADIRRRLIKLKPGETFVWRENHNVYNTAETIGIKVKTTKLNGTGFLVERLT